MRLPPVYTPLTAGALASAFGVALRDRSRAAADLEDLVRRRFDARAVVLTSSGTHALQLALEAVPHRAGVDATVAMPAYSCFDLITAAVGAGVRIRFYDVDPATLCPDLDSVRHVVRRGVDAVVAGNLHGYPLDWEGLRSVATEAGVPLIEDAAQSIGARTDAGRAGGLGHVSVLSFGRGKGFGGGGGGALLVGHGAGPDVAIPEVAASGSVRTGFGLRSALVTTAAWALGRPSLYRIPASMSFLGLGETRYHDPSPPSGIAAFAAALAVGGADRCDAAVEGRRAVASRLLAAIGDAGSVRPCEPRGGLESAGFLRLPLVAASERVAVALAARGGGLGVMRGYPKPLYEVPAAAAVVEGAEERLVGAETLARRLLTLPTHRWVTSRYVERLAGLVRSVDPTRPAPVDT